MFSYLLAAALIVTMPMMAECNCSPEKIEALRAKLRAEGATDEKVKAVNCEDVCEAEKPLADASQGRDESKEDGSQLANSNHERDESNEGSQLANSSQGRDESKEGSQLACEDCTETEQETELLAGCDCGKKGKGRS